MTGLNVLRLLPKCALLLTLTAAIGFASAADQPATSSEWQKAVQLQQQKGTTTDPTNLKAALGAVATQQPTTSTVPATASSRVIATTTKSTRTQPIKISANSNRPAPQAHVWNLKDADLMQVIAEVARETGKNFIVDPQVSGKVTIISTKPLAAAEVYQMFLSTLQVLNFAAVPAAGNVTKIIPLHDAGREPGAVYSGAAPEGGAMVVDVIPLQYISAIQLVPILNPLIPTWATVSSVVTANSLIVSGSQSVVNRVHQIIERVDTPASNGVDVIPMQYSIADDVAKELTDLIQSARSYGEMVNVAISSDERSNSILLSGNAPARLRLKVLISQLDQPGSNGMGDTQVIHLHYIQVQDILPILRGIADQNPGTAGASSSSPVSMQSSSSENSSGGSGGLTSDYSNFTNQVQSITNAELNSGAVTS
ncbi:MAG: hypothetical protein K5Q00_00075, partial [Gammaproteobacteria bacterium]|nr:hypothetical protein [Gammaproteobacteria bacterium]